MLIVCFVLRLLATAHLQRIIPVNVYLEIIGNVLSNFIVADNGKVNKANVDKILLITCCL